MSSHPLGDEKVFSQRFNVSFPVEPPAKVDVIPREFLYPFYLVMTVVTLVILVTTKLVPAMIILGAIAGLCYFGYRKFNAENVESQKAIEETFFLPLEDQFGQQGIKISRTKMAYLWNHDSVFLFTKPFSLKRISLLNNWNSDAIIGVEDNVSFKELLPN